MTSDRKRRVSVEVVARMDIPHDTPMQRLLLHKTLTLPLIIAPTSATERSQPVEADFLTFQNRITQGDYWLPPMPYSRPQQVSKTRAAKVVDVLNDYRVGRGIPGTIEQTEGLARRIVAALDQHDVDQLDALRKAP
jgi:hypothetical protein